MRRASCRLTEWFTPLRDARAFRLMIEVAFQYLECVAGPRAGANSCSNTFSVVVVADSKGYHLDRCIDATDGHQRKSRMTLDNVHNAAIPFQDVDQFATRFLPYKKVTVIRTRGDVFVIRTQKIHYGAIASCPLSTLAKFREHSPSFTVSTLQWPEKSIRG